MIGKIVSHYRIMEELGRGGMGIVYKARDTRQDKIVALKVLTGGALSAAELQRRFKREASAGMKINHPNIVRIFEVGEDNAQFFISMEFIDGKTVRQILQDGPLDPKKVIDIGVKVCHAFNLAHEEGIIHRDMKCDNIMVTSQEEVKVMDFGIAKVSDASILTQEGTILGTVAYMSPEQAIGEAVDHRSDIFSLGVVLFETLTGQLPFVADYELATIYAIVNEEPPDMRELNPGIPEALEQVVAKAMQKEQQHRYQSVNDLADDLEKVKLFIEGGPDTRIKVSDLLAGADRLLTKDKAFNVKLAGRRGFEARLTGREEPFEILKEHFSRSVQGEGRTVFLSGEAGIGKSRLVLEFEKYARTMKIKMLTGRCPANQSAYPYQPFVEAIRNYFDIKGISSDKMLEEFIRSKTPELIPQLPVIRTFLNIKEGEDKTIESKEQMWDAIFKLVARISIGFFK